MHAVLAEGEARCAGTRKIAYRVEPMFDSRGSATRCEFVDAACGGQSSRIIGNVQISRRIERHSGRIKAIFRGLRKSSDVVVIGEIRPRYSGQRTDIALGWGAFDETYGCCTGYL